MILHICDWIYSRVHAWRIGDQFPFSPVLMTSALKRWRQDRCSQGSSRPGVCDAVGTWSVERKLRISLNGSILNLILCVFLFKGTSFGRHFLQTVNCIVSGWWKLRLWRPLALHRLVCQCPCWSGQSTQHSAHSAETCSSTWSFLCVTLNSYFKTFFCSFLI